MVAKHMVAVSTNLKDVAAFGIDAQKGTFAFWDWSVRRMSPVKPPSVEQLLLRPPPFARASRSAHIASDCETAPNDRSLRVYASTRIAHASSLVFFFPLSVCRVGGRYSVTSAVGLLPLALHYSYATVDK